MLHQNIAELYYKRAGEWKCGKTEEWREDSLSACRPADAFHAPKCFCSAFLSSVINLLLTPPSIATHTQSHFLSFPSSSLIHVLTLTQNGIFRGLFSCKEEDCLCAVCPHRPWPLPLRLSLIGLRVIGNLAGLLISRTMNIFGVGNFIFLQTLHLNLSAFSGVRWRAPLHALLCH